MNFKKTIITYGLLFAGISVTLFLIRFLGGFLYENTLYTRIIFDVPPIFIMLGCIFLGIYWQQKKNPTLKFSQMLKIGMGITLVGALIIATYHVIFITYIDTDFLQKSMEMQLQQIVTLQPEMTQEEYAQTRQSMQESGTAFVQFNLWVVKNLFLGFFLTIGISSLIKLLPKHS